MPDFEEFDRQAPPVATDPTFTIQTRGIISLNRASFDAMGQPEAIKLLFDRASRIIGFRPVPVGTANAYVVRRQGESPTFLIAGTAFCHHYGIDTSQTRRYLAQAYDDIWGIDLNGESTVIIGARAASRQRSAGDVPTPSEARGHSDAQHTRVG